MQIQKIYYKIIHAQRGLAVMDKLYPIPSLYTYLNIFGKYVSTFIVSLALILFLCVFLFLSQFS
jgi:hypothetical protein